MKRVILSVVVLATLTFTSCKDEKKAEKAHDAVKTEVKAVEKKVEEVKTEVKETAVAALSEKATKGLAIMEGFTAEKCSVCHKADVKTVGPSYKEIAKTYKEKKGNLVKFLKGNGEAIVDPPLFSVMKPNLEATKKLSGDDLASVAAYIRSFE